MTKSLAELRREYALGALTRQTVDPDPFGQFGRWLQEAMNAQLLEPNAMTLATVGRGGRPSARVVLLKGFDEQGFVFYTNYLSDKGRQWADNPNAALTFLWKELERQVRIEGSVSKVSQRESEAYFRTRPKESQLGALASNQSEVVENRQILEMRFAELSVKYADDEVPIPAHWGGYRLSPMVLEFWQGRPSRLHDRLRYRRLSDGGWLIERLEP